MTDNKRFYWLKLRRDFFKRHDIKILESMPQGKEYVLFYIKLLAESVDHGGELRFNETIPYTADMLAAVTDTDTEVVDKALENLKTLGLLVVADDGTMSLPYAVKLIDSCADNDNARRQARYRNKSSDFDNCVTKSNGRVTQSNATSNGESNARVTDSNANSNAQSNGKVTGCVTKSNEILDIEIDTRVIDKERESIEREKNGDRSPRTRFIKPSPDDILSYFTDYAYKKGISIDPVVESERFYNYYESNGWRVGRNPMRDYKAACRNWLLNNLSKTNPLPPSANPFGDLLGGEVL